MTNSAKKINVQSALSKNYTDFGPKFREIATESSNNHFIIHEAEYPQPENIKESYHNILSYTIDTVRKIQYLSRTDVAEKTFKIWLMLEAYRMETGYDSEQSVNDFIFDTEEPSAELLRKFIKLPLRDIPLTCTTLTNSMSYVDYYEQDEDDDYTVMFENSETYSLIEYCAIELYKLKNQTLYTLPTNIFSEIRDSLMNIEEEVRIMFYEETDALHENQAYENLHSHQSQFMLNEAAKMI